MAESDRVRLGEKKIAKIFEEWDRRWREKPEEFTDLVTHLTKETPLTYGEKCAPYFIRLAREIG
jgi:hypothetical protein